MWKSRLFYLLGSWILVLASIQLLPLLHALATGNAELLSAFFASGMVSLMLGGALFLGFRSTGRVRVPRLTIFLPIAGVGTMALIAGLPLFFLFPERGFAAAYFDGMSQITTSGSTAYGVALEALPTVQLWRGLTSWVGGLMAISFALSLLTGMNSGAMQLHRSPLHFGDSEAGYSRLKQTTIAVLPIYVAVTLVAYGLLWLTGNSAFDAFLLALGLVSTSGVVPEATIQAQGLMGQAVMTLFLIFGLSNWDFHLLRTRKLSLCLRQDRELRLTLALLALGTGALFLFVELDGEGLMDLVFAAASALSTFGSMPSVIADLDAGAALPVAIILLLLAAVGGAVASTSGGLKQMRVILIYKLGRAEIDRLAHPHGVHTVQYGDAVAEKRDVDAVWLLLGSFVAVMAVGAIALAVLGIHIQDALTLAFTAMTLSGPLAVSADAGFAGYESLAHTDYYILSLLMLIGRVETSVFMAIFARALWRG